MQLSTQCSRRVHVVLASLFAILIVPAGASGAESASPGAMDLACVNECSARAYEPEFCNRVCRVPPPPRGRFDEVTDWTCMSTCAQRGGKYGECKPSCRLR
jgi:hypothetical protein